MGFIVFTWSWVRIGGLVTPPHDKDSRMQVWQEPPFNAEPPPQAFWTRSPDVSFYVRATGPCRSWTRRSSGWRRGLVDGTL